MTIQQQLKKFQHEKLNEIITELELPDDFIAQLQQQEIDVKILSMLINAKQYPAAVKFLSLGLPKREAIWWAYLCAQAIEGKKNCQSTQTALRIISEWVANPDEQLRRQAKQLADALEHSTPISWAAMAVFWSQGSIAPHKQPEIEADEMMCGHAVSNAIVLACTESENENDQIKYFLKQGLHIAMGGNGNV